MANLDKQAVLDAVRDHLISDTTIRAWAPGTIKTVDEDPTDEHYAQAATRGNFIFVRDGGLMEIKRSTGSRIVQLTIDIAICARKAARVKDTSGRTVLGIEDDMRRQLTDARALYAATGVSILDARVINSPPTATVWGGLYERATDSGFRMAVIQYRLTMIERR